MTQTHQIPLIAGYNDNGEPVVEQVNVTPVEGTTNEFRLHKSPAFVRSVAADDRIRFPADNTASFELLEHSGNLSIRVFSKLNTAQVDEALTPELELMGGRLDVSSTGLLVYTIHVSIGFKRIEALLDSTVGRFPDTIWYYGNVYDPEDGVTPLNWWDDIAQSV
jgi:hypothetical protein